MRLADKPPVDELFSQLSNSRVAIRHRAARVLGALNDEAVSERLARMALGAVGRREALLALLASSDPVARQFLTYAQSRSDLGPSVRGPVHEVLILSRLHYRTTSSRSLS